MLRGILRRKDIPVEVKEMRELADLILKRIEKKLTELKAMEKRIDDKVELLKTLLEKAEGLRDKETRSYEVITLYKKGLSVREIAESLHIPSGEVELILRVCKDYQEGKNFPS